MRFQLQFCYISGKSIAKITRMFILLRYILIKLDRDKTKVLFQSIVNEINLSVALVRKSRLLRKIETIK